MHKHAASTKSTITGTGCADKGRTAVALFQYHSKWGQPRRGSGPAVQGLGVGGGGGGHEEYRASAGHDRLPFRPRLDTSNLHRPAPDLVFLFM